MKVRTKSNAIALTTLIVIVLGTGIWLTRNQPQRYREPVEEITLGAYAGDTASLVWVAQDQDYFLANGLDMTIKEYEAGKLAADALLADEVDIATAAGFVFVSNSFDYADLSVLGTVATAEVKELVARKDKGITTTDDLIGKKIGVTKRSGGEFLLGTFFIFNGRYYSGTK